MRRFRRFLLILATLGAVWIVARIGSSDPKAERSDPPPGEGIALRSEHARSEPGVVVESLAPGGAAESAGLRVGDRLLHCDGAPVPAPAVLQAALENAAPDAPLDLVVDRDGAPIRLRAPRSGLGLVVRPELSPEIRTRYEEGRQAGDSGRIDAAAAAYSDAAGAAARAGDRVAAAWLHVRAAQAYELLQRWNDASGAYLAASELAPRDSETASRSRILVALAKCRQQLADPAQALRCLEEAKQLDAAAGREIWAAADAHALGTLTWSQGDLESARDSFSDAVAVRERRLPDSPQLGESLNGLGAVAYQRGDLDEAEAHYRRSVAICERALPDSLAVADGLNNLGVVAIARGDLDAAYDYHSRSLAIRERVAPGTQVVTAALTNLGIVEYKRGRLQAAQEYYGRSLAIHERLGSESLYLARDYINLGVIAYDRGDLDAAQDHYSRGLAILERLAPDSPDCMASVFNLGMVAADRGDWDAAQRNLARALAYRERTAPDSLAVAESCNALGNLAFARFDLDAAESHYLRALHIEERLAPDSLLVSVSEHNLAGVALRRGRFEEAEERYRRALAMRERMAPGSLDLASSLHGLGDIALRRGRPDEALPLLLRAIETVEAQRDHIHGIRSRAFLIARYSEPYLSLQRAYLALGDLPSAFGTIERARARSLLDGLGEARADIREGVEPALLARERELQEKLSATESERREAAGRADRSRLTEIEQALNGLLVEYEDVQGQIRRASPRYAALTQPQPLSLEEIQREVLDADTVLLEYALGRERSHLWFVTSEEIRHFELPDQEEVDRAARRVHELVTARNHGPDGERVEAMQERVARADAEYREAAAALSRTVLGPVAERLDRKRLLIVADGALQYVPFGALPVPERAGLAAEGGDFASGDAATAPAADRPPLIVDHEVISLPSASVLAVLRRELAGRERAPKSVAVLADPVLEPTDPRVIAREGAAPSGESSEPERARGVVRIEPRIVRRLRFSRQEAESILALVADPGFAALDFAADKRTALDPELSRYRIVHLATHGLLDSQHPELSGIVLSLVDERGEARDGFLRLHEIYNLRWNADLVVLSACQTALGREVRGEGLVGLTRGFMYAGAERVVASLWNVQDQATSELMTRFYEAMFHQGQTAAAALRAAQLAMWREGRAPYFWAAFVLQGEFE